MAFTLVPKKISYHNEYTRVIKKLYFLPFKKLWPMFKFLWTKSKTDKRTDRAKEYVPYVLIQRLKSIQLVDLESQHKCSEMIW